MKRIKFFSTAVAGAILFASLFGCGKPNNQETEPRADRARETGASSAAAKSAEEAAGDHSNTPAGAALFGETKPAGDSTEGQPSGQGTFALSDTPQPVDGFKGTKVQETLMSPDGSVYEGDVVDGKPSGRGTSTNPNGTRQQGEWRDGNAYKLSGTWVGPDGTREVGTWNFDGTKSGGTITWNNGREYKGDWKCVDGAAELPDGMGAMTWPDGSKYVGQFRDGLMDGTGKLTHPDGKIEEGMWRQGKFVGPAKL